MRWIIALAILLTAQPARAEAVDIPGPEGVVLKAELFRPEGASVAPAIVALHGCGGPYPSRDRQWTELLTRAGHMVLFPDSFGSRGLKPQCRVQDRVATASGLREQDALAAIRYLATRPDVPPGGVVLLGWSDGGSTVLAAGETGAGLEPGLLRGLIAFYPGCRVPSLDPTWRPAAPLLLMIGQSDDWTPAAPCEALAKNAAPSITLETYPGAFHDFDAPVALHALRNIPHSQNADHSVHAGEDPAAREDAMARVPAFLAALPLAR
jgi:dienelactone hydrolase